MWLTTVLVAALGLACVGCEDSPLRQMISGETSAASDANSPLPDPDATKKEVTLSSLTDDAVEVKYAPDAVIPTTFPEDIPVYRDCAVEKTESTPGQKKYRIRLTSPDDIESVFRYYEQTIPGKGWNVDGSLTDTKDLDIRILGYTKAGRFLSTTLIKTDAGTMIDLSTGPMNG